MKLPHWICAAAVAVSLTACGKNEPPPLPDVPGFGEDAGEPVASPRDFGATISAFESFADEAFRQGGGKEVDLSGVQAALPDWISLSWDSETFDAASGASEFENLAVTIHTEPSFGISMETARVWGLDSDFLAARLSGERLAESGKLLDRLEARNVRYFGMANALNTAFEALNDLESGAAMMDVRDLSMTIDRVVSAGMSLRPFDYVPISEAQFAALDGAMEGDDGLPPVQVMPESGPQDAGPVTDETLPAETQTGLPVSEIEIVRIAQQALAVGRSVSTERGAAFGLTMRFDMASSGPDYSGAGGMTMRQTQKADIAFYGYEGIEGLDIGQLIVSKGRESQSMSMEGEGAEEIGYGDGFAFSQAQTYDFSMVEGLKLDKLAGFLARSEFPSMKERDLMSFGTWSVQGYEMKLSSKDVFRAELMQFKADDFAWLIPEAMSLDIRGASVAPQELGEMVLTFLPRAALSEEDQSYRADIATAIDLMDDHGFASIPFDISVKGSWNADDGETRFRFSSEAEDFGNRLMRFAIKMPDYAQIEALEASGEAFEPGFEALFQKNFAFIGARYFESDEGGYDKLFAYLHALGAIYEDQGWGATLAGMPPERMRGFIAAALRSGAGSLPKEYPQMTDWLEAAAAYFETSGGSLDIRMEPATPLTPDAIKASAEAGDDEAWLDQFGISVTHTPE